MKTKFLILISLMLLSGCAAISSGQLINEKISIDDAYSILQTSQPNYFSQAEYQTEKSYDQYCAYQLYLPKNYQASQKYPLLLSFSLDAAIWKKLADKYQFIFARADCSKYLMAAIKEKIDQQYSIDAKKIYLTGFSAGAYRSWDLLYDLPAEFSGAILASGGALFEATDKSMADKRFYLTLGEKDYAENIASAKELNQYLLKNGAQTVFELEPGASHQYPTGKNEKMISFLLNK